jgi:hydroxylaminobenzene mutase
MTRVYAQAAANPGQSHYLTMNGAVMILAGLLSGLTVGAAPYPRLMLTAHIQFLVNGMMSVFAGLMLKTSLSIVSRRSGTLIVWGHISAWAVCFSEVAAALWGANKALPIAAAQAGAPGAAPWQESLVVACHVVPAFLLIASWTFLVLGAYRGRNSVTGT